MKSSQSFKLMKKKNLVIAEMQYEDITNGVSRYVEMLCDGLPADLFNIIHLRLTFFKRIAFPKQIVHDDYIEIVVPLPANLNEIIDNNFWNSEYNKIVGNFIEPLLERNFIFHIQSMNLINLAVYLREKFHCKIVSHIHCIPWKYSYASNQQLFNQIYYKLNIERDVTKDSFCSFITKNEYALIKESDIIICVTENTLRYYKKYLHVKSDKILCVYNGIRDELCDFSLAEIQSVHRKDIEPLRLMYAGNVTRNKGFHFVLEALRKVRTAGYDFILYVAGIIEEEMQMLINEKYSNLDIRLLGHISYSELQKYYRTSHIGLISSLFEQCSYVALEMSMYGLPVIYSGIDELHEIFNRSDYMHVPINFSIHSGLHLDIDIFASKIISLIESSTLRDKIGMNERCKFIKYFKQEDMIQKTVEIYNNL